MFNDIIKNTFMSLAMTREQINPLLSAGFKFEKYKIIIDNNISEIYLYGVIPDSLSLFVPSALLDYSIVDDAGGRYTITFSYCSNNNNTFGFILATSERISGYCWAPMWADCFYNETNWHNKTIVVNGELIVSKTPQIDFQVPIEQIGKITKIQIQPATFKKTNKIEDIHTFSYNYFILLTLSISSEQELSIRKNGLKNPLRTIKGIIYIKTSIMVKLINYKQEIMQGNPDQQIIEVSLHPNSWERFFGSYPIIQKVFQGLTHATWQVHNHTK